MKLRYIIFTICLVILSSITSVSLKAVSTDCNYGNKKIRAKEVEGATNNAVTLWIETYPEESNGKEYVRLPIYSAGTEGVYDIGTSRYYFVMGDFTTSDSSGCPANIKIANIENTSNSVICAPNETQSVCSGNSKEYAVTSEKIVDYSIHASPLCTKLNMVWTILGYIIFAIQVVTPLVLIIMGSLGMVKAVTAENENKIKDAQDLLVKRIIAAVLVFLLIFITKVVVNLVLGNKYEMEWQACVHCALNPFDSKKGCGIKTVEFIIPEGD